MNTLRQSVIPALLEADAVRKAAMVQALPDNLPVGADTHIAPCDGIPGRSEFPRLVPATALRPQSLRTAEGRAALIHSIVHIERNAIDLALDIIYRFAGMPDAFYREWLTIAKEEALHFTLLRNHLTGYGFEYGHFDAHNALWDMAEKTRHDLLARVALVPRTLEARGLDASPQVKKKLVGAGDVAVGPILDIILRDEIGHVAVGNKWYRWLCTERGLEPLATYAELVKQYQPPQLRQPFNLEARRLAGFVDAEIDALLSQAG